MNRPQQDFEFELENEFEGELDNEFEGEAQSDFESLGNGGNEQILSKVIGGLLGEQENQWEGYGEFASELSAGMNESEQEEFFGKIRGFLKRSAPLLKRVAKVAVPMVASVVGGPVGGMLGKVATSNLLGEGELEGDFEDEFEFESEGEFEVEGEFETVLSAPMSESEVLGEVLGEMAALAQSEYEAEAMMGAATATIISASDRAALRRLVPHLTRGAAVLTRILRRSRATRPVVRAVPSIVRTTVKTLSNRAAKGQPINRKVAAKVMAANTRKVLQRPQACALAIRKNTRASQGLRR